MNILRENDVALYCSRLSKVEISIEEQLERLKKYCKHFGLNIVKEYIDTDNVNKPLFNQMVEDVKSKAFNIVLSYSLDTLSKNDNDIYKLVNELDKYDYELQLESSYKYKAVSKPLFKLPRDDNEKKEKLERKAEEKAKKKQNGMIKCYPMLRECEIKNPKSDNPYNWVELLDVGRCRFEEEPLFDNLGNYLGNKRDVFIIFKEITGFYRSKERKEEIEKNKSKLKTKNLFDWDNGNNENDNLKEKELENE